MSGSAVAMTKIGKVSIGLMIADDQTRPAISSRVAQSRTPTEANQYPRYYVNRDMPFGMQNERFSAAARAFGFSVYVSPVYGTAGQLP